jgi:hypothetical protein
MSSCPERAHAAAAGCLCAGRWLPPPALARPPRPTPGIGRAATPKEVAAWDIDVRPDFKGLPKGSGSVARAGGLGGQVRPATASSAKSNEVFTPAGRRHHQGRREDRPRGAAAGRGFPGRTTLMKVATVSTLWDYINRAMPWNAPKSLSPDEVYAVTAFLLNLGDVVPDNFTLSTRTSPRCSSACPTATA